MIRPTILFVAMVFAAALVGCSERAPRSDPEGGQAYNYEPQTAHSSLRERTEKQAASSRMVD
jgi:hypothetical protein